ncbi:hypothetical protein NBRC116493_20660 [Aurantivibrio infirmus]
MTDKPSKLNCPQCNETVTWTDDFPYRPFCSKRCQLIDFGAWAKEEHKISGDSVFDSNSSEDENDFS